MATDRFLFRDTYAIPEKIDRIPTSRISKETPEIQRRLGELSLSESEIRRIGKNDFFEEAEDHLSETAFQEFVSDLFDQYGVKGDKFNMQLYLLKESISKDNLLDLAEQYENERLDRDFDSLNDPIVLTEYRENEDSVDIQFRTTARLENIEADDNIPIQIIEIETGETIQNYGSEYRVKAPARYRVEVRAYPDKELLAVSNYARIGEGLQTSIADTVTELGRTFGSGIGVTTRLKLNQTQLLLLLQEMEGDISGLGYTIEIAGVDTADYTGQRDEDMVGTELIQVADEAGQIRKIKFYVDHPAEDESEERDVMLRIFDDGHLTTSKPVPTNLLDVIIRRIDTIRDYNEYLTPLNELLRSYVREKFRGKSTMMRQTHISNTHEAFNDLIEEYFESDETPTEELRLYKSMIANIGVKLCKEGFSEPSAAEGATDGFLAKEGKIQEFFNDYNRRVLEDPTDVDFDGLSSQLDHLLRQNWDSPTDIIEYAIETYDLSR